MGQPICPWASPSAHGPAHQPMGQPICPWASPSAHGPAHLPMGQPISPWASPSAHINFLSFFFIFHYFRELVIRSSLYDIDDGLYIKLNASLSKTADSSNVQ